MRCTNALWMRTIGEMFGRLEPAGEIGDRFEIERAVLQVDHAVVEAGRLDDPRDAARGELLEAGAERRPPFAHGPADAVLFHGFQQTRQSRGQSDLPP